MNILVEFTHTELHLLENRIPVWLLFLIYYYLMKKDKNPREQLIQPKTSTYFRAHFVNPTQKRMGLPLPPPAVIPTSHMQLEESRAAIRKCQQLDRTVQFEKSPWGCGLMSSWSNHSWPRKEVSYSPQLACLLFLFPLSLIHRSSCLCLPALLHIWCFCDPTLFVNPGSLLIFI